VHVNFIIFLYLVVTNVYGNEKEKENWRIVINKVIYARIKKTYYNRDNKVK